MGNSSHTSNERFLRDWTQLQQEGVPGALTNVWAKKQNRAIQMQEYPLHVTSQEEVDQQKKIHQLRHNHQMLVSSLYFKDETKEEFCSSDYKGKIFIQRIPLTLETVTDIPFPDALHVYSQSLQGFHILASQVENGCFPVSEEHIGVNTQGVVKVWMNSKYDRNYPTRNERIPQEKMVANIFQVIDENIDFASLNGKPRPRQYIQSKSKSPAQIRFGEAITLLRNYTNQFFNGEISHELECVKKVGGAFTLSKNWRNMQSLPKRQEYRKSDLIQTSPTNQYLSNIQSSNNQHSQQLSTPFFNNSNLIQTNLYEPTEPVNYGWVRQQNNSIVRNLVPQQNILREQPRRIIEQRILSNQPAKISERPIIIQQPRNLDFSHSNPHQIGQNHILHNVPLKRPSQSQLKFSQQIHQNQFNSQNSFLHRSSSLQQNSIPEPHRLQFKQIKSVISHQVSSNRNGKAFIPNQDAQKVALPVSIDRNIQNLQQNIILTGQRINQTRIVQSPQNKNLNQAPRMSNIQFQQKLNANNQISLINNQPNNPFIQGTIINNQVVNREISQLQVDQQRRGEQQRFIRPQVRRQSQQSSGNVVFAQSFAEPFFTKPNQPQVVSKLFFRQQPTRSSPIQNGNIKIAIPQSQANQISHSQSAKHIQSHKLQNTQQFVQHEPRAYAQQNVKVNNLSLEGFNQNFKVINQPNQFRYNEQSISSINAATNQMRSNQQISDKFSMIKQEEVMDTSTKNFYKNMMDYNYDASAPVENNTSNYYTNYANKLYDNQYHNNYAQSESQSFQVASQNRKPVVYQDRKLNDDAEIQNKNFTKNDKETTGMYKVTLDDGMSSPDFLNQLKSMNFSFTGSSFKKTQIKHDYGKTVEANNTFLNKAANSQNYGSNINEVQIVRQEFQGARQEASHYNNSKNYDSSQENKNQTNIRYESQFSDLKTQKIQNQEQYDQNNYQSTFERYAKYPRNVVQTYSNENSHQQVYSGGQYQQVYRGDQYEAKNVQFAQNNQLQKRNGYNFQVSKGSINTTSYQQNNNDEEYKVDFDPEILADLQKLKN